MIERIPTQRYGNGCKLVVCGDVDVVAETVNDKDESEGGIGEEEEDEAEANVEEGDKETAEAAATAEKVPKPHMTIVVVIYEGAHY